MTRRMPSIVSTIALAIAIAIALTLTGQPTLARAAGRTMLLRTSTCARSSAD